MTVKISYVDVINDINTLFIVHEDDHFVVIEDIAETAIGFN